MALPHLPDVLGRDQEVSQSLALLAEPGLVTIVGPGGMGKTTLALAALQAMDDATIIGRCFLARCANGVAVQSALATVLDTELGASDPIQRLAVVLKERGRGVLLLDNAEHVPDAVAEIVEALLQTAPLATVLVTSREVLRVPGERVLELGSLAKDMSKRLFIRTARAGNLLPNAESILDQLLKRLDGIPLALKIVAGRSHLMPPQELLTHLDTHGLKFKTRTRGTPERHRSMESAIQWSWKLIHEDEKQVLKQLAVFRVLPTVSDLSEFLEVPDFTTPLEVLESLRDSSMLLPDMRMAVLIRDFVWTQTDPEERRAMQKRHADWCLKKVVSQTAKHASRGPRLTALRNAPGLDNLQAAATALAPIDPGRALQLLEPALNIALWFGPLSHFEDLLNIVPVASLPQPVQQARRLHLEIRGQILLHQHRPETVYRALELAPADSEERVLLLMNAASLVDVDGEQRLDWASEAAELAERVAPHLKCHAWLSLQYVEKARANNEKALYWFGKIVAENPQDHGLLLDAHVDAAGCLFKLDRDASELLRTAERLTQQGGAHRERAGVTMQLGVMYVRTSQHELARPLLKQAIDHYRVLGSSTNIAGCWANLGYMSLIDGDLDTATAHFLNVDKYLPLDTPALQAVNQAHQAIVAAARRNWQRADGLFAQSTDQMAPGHAAGFRAMHGVVLARLGQMDEAEAQLRRAQQDIEPAIAGGVDICAAMARSEALPPVEIPGLFGQIIDLFIATVGAPLLKIHETEGWVAFQNTQTPLRKRSGPWALLLALARARNKRFDNDDLFKAGWPGQRISGPAATHRVHVALSTLRKLGLGETIHRNDDGYALTDKLVVEWLPS